MSQRLHNKVAIVTGAAQGIGQAIAIRLAEEGAAVGIADISRDALSKTTAAIEAQSGRVLAQACDVTDSRSVVALFDAVTNQFGRLDVLVNNAGIGTAPNDGFDLYQQRMAERGAQLQAGETPTVYADHIPDMQDDGWLKVVDVNLNGTFYACREAVRQMIKHNSAGSIINIASTSAVSGEGGVHYCASKAAILGLTKSLAMEMAPRNIRVNAICPGPTNTPIMANISDEWKQAMVAAIPLGRIGEPVEIANTALFLASDESSSFTGQTLMANLGTYLA
ncbi:3-oxoacyl-[acyl-carrier protein] reductase [Litorivivens lipolytica]|uniref:3-oxoacyl-[acyl-carrier protein] reductase n=1 Tax=Litorivivens lipolytica TaxID=1524264 RepID=A0A7W4W574_9GAMM|nr:SDR family NAD(P)-dependent oxidoreductase [Litorivivens lipolytica]MBB3047665.1 3-oxoacyl-[acyl-carrier protein] reductase [Litorivivens lipolytica]